MPKLNGAAAKAASESAENAPAGEFPILDEGTYRLRLTGVEVSKVGQSKDPKLVGAPVWIWKYDLSPDDESGTSVSAKFWDRRTLAPKGAESYDFLNGLFVAPFDAFGVPVDTDTDDLIGRDLRAYVVQQVAKGGKRAGKIVNQIESLLPLDGALAHAGAGAGGKSDEDFGY